MNVSCIIWFCHHCFELHLPRLASLDTQGTGVSTKNYVHGIIHAIRIISVKSAEDWQLGLSEYVLCRRKNEINSDPFRLKWHDSKRNEY